MADLSESESRCALRSRGGASRMSVIMKRVRGARSRSSRCTVIASAPPAGPPPPPGAAPSASSAGHPRPTHSSIAPSSPLTVPSQSKIISTEYATLATLDQQCFRTRIAGTPRISPSSSKSHVLPKFQTQ